jgi:glutamate dehydrogenase/leucine dehydrogenase
VNVSLKTLDARDTEPGVQTAIAEAQGHFDRVAHRLGLDPAARQLLRAPMREHRVLVPVRMDDGTTKVVEGIRVQHNNARDPSWAGFDSTHRRPQTTCARWPC